MDDNALLAKSEYFAKCWKFVLWTKSWCVHRFFSYSGLNGRNRQKKEWRKDNALIKFLGGVHNYAVSYRALSKLLTANEHISNAIQFHGAGLSFSVLVCRGFNQSMYLNEVQWIWIQKRTEMLIKIKTFEVEISQRFGFFNLAFVHIFVETGHFLTDWKSGSYVRRKNKSKWKQ